MMNYYSSINCDESVKLNPRMRDDHLGVVMIPPMWTQIVCRVLPGGVITTRVVFKRYAPGFGYAYPKRRRWTAGRLTHQVGCVGSLKCHLTTYYTLLTMMMISDLVT